MEDEYPIVSDEYIIKKIDKSKVAWLNNKELLDILIYIQHLYKTGNCHSSLIPFRTSPINRPECK